VNFRLHAASGLVLFSLAVVSVGCPVQEASDPAIAPPIVQALSGDARELRAAFNADADKVRLIFLLSPS